MISQTEFYFFIFFAAAVLSAFFLVLAKKISFKYNLYDDPQKDGLKVHKIPISFFGGAAMLCSFLLCLLLIWLFKKGQNFNFENSKIIAVFIGSIVAWFYGFWDDTYWQDRKKIAQSAKIFLQFPIVLVLALIFYTAGIKYDFFSSSFFSIFLAAFLFLFVQNAVNLQDGLDGLASGIILISSLSFFIFFALSGNIFPALLACSIAGAVGAFLIFNWHPASIFMGNNGSYFLGFLMVVFGIMASMPGRFFYSFFPYLFLATPVLNVLYVFAKRGVAGKSFFTADRRHLHDDLFYATKSVPKSVLIIYLIQLIFSLAGLSILLIV